MSGSGKTYLAVAKAVQALQAKQVNRIVLTRPAVEAGEHLGFLPGTLSEKIDPYLRPLYDALQDMIDPDKIPKLMTNGSIEVAPLAYMRGRTLNDSFIQRTCCFVISCSSTNKTETSDLVFTFKNLSIWVIYLLTFTSSMEKLLELSTSIIN